MEIENMKNVICTPDIVRDQPSENGDLLPLISVLVPCYNVESTLRRCLDSLTGQTLRNIEIVCVNDGSGDGTLSILREYSAKDTRVKIIDKQQNEGLYLARKSGVLAASGKFITMVDSDDELLPDACERMAAGMEAAPADMLQFDVEVINETGVADATAWLETAFRPTPEPIEGADILKSFYVDRTNLTSVYSKVYTRELCMTAYSSIPDFYCYVGEDIFTMFYLAYYCRSWRGVPDYKAYRYYRGGGVSNEEPVALGKFRQYCNMSLCVSYACSFLEEHGAAEYAWEAENAMARRMTIDCVRMFRDRLIPEDRQDGWQLLKTAWGGERDWNEVVQNELKQSAQELDRLYKKIPVYIRRGSAWDSETERSAVSVIIPVYNTEKYLRECLDSVVKQSLRELEIICVNDGSTDDSLIILEEYAARDDRITLVSRLNGGLSAARNSGVRVARGEYLYFMDSDDYLLPNAMEELYLRAQRNRTDILYFSAESFAEDEASAGEAEKYKGYYARTGTQGAVSAEKQMRRFMDSGEFRSSCPLQFFRREFYEQSGLAFQEGLLHEDELFSPLALSRAERVAVDERAFYRRRIHQSSIMTSVKTAKHFSGYFEGAALLRQAAGVLPDGDCRREFLRSCAERLDKNASSVLSQLSFEELGKIPETLSATSRGLYANSKLQAQAERLKRTAKSDGTRTQGGKSLWTRLGGALQCLKEHGFAYTVKEIRKSFSGEK